MDVSAVTPAKNGFIYGRDVKISRCDSIKYSVRFVRHILTRSTKLLMEESIEGQFYKIPITPATVEHYIRQWKRVLRYFRITWTHGGTNQVRMHLPSDYIISVRVRAGKDAPPSKWDEIEEKDLQLIKDHIKNLKKLQAHLLEHPNLLW